MKKTFAALLAGLVLVMGLTACGQGSSQSSSGQTSFVDQGSGQSASASDSQSSESSSPANSQGSEPGAAMKAIQDKGVLTMMTATGFPPYEYIGEDGKPAGIDIDIAQMVADKLGVQLEVLDMDFNLLVDSLKSGKGQLVAAAMSITEDRAAQIDFSVPYASDGQCLMVPKGSDIQSVEDLEGKTVTVQEATTGHIYAEETLGLTTMAFKNAVECATAIMGGKADAAILDKITVMTLTSANPDQLDMVPEQLTEEQYVLGIAKDNEDFQAVVNEVLQAAIDDGTVDGLLETHLAICKDLQNAG